MDETDAIVSEFLVESHENLDQLDRDLVDLEQNPEEKNLLASVFRTIHTIKGTCGFLGFSKLESIAHVGENLLSKLRDGELKLSPEIADGMLAMVDAVRQILNSIERNRNEGDVDYSQLIETLTKLNKGEKVSIHPPPTQSQEFESAEPVETSAPMPTEVIETPDNVIDQVPEEEETINAATEDAPAKSSIAESTIRVDVDILDKLMNLVGELVLARNQILQHTATFRDATFAASSQHLNLITTELQEGVMKTRMQPIGNIWNKFPRVVRDLANACGKKVNLEMEGKETELDKTLIEAIKDPLTHIVRNSVDHGIETPEVRLANGKKPEGCLKLRAYHEGGQVNIEITDDGGGIDPDKLKAKAIQKNLISSEQAAQMSDREVTHLIFSPGFSTAAKVTNVSGRGVGMDVVKTNIEKIGGTVDVQSQKGKGTTLKVKIPLTLAIIPALIVNCGEKRYAIPQVSLLELVRLDGETRDTHNKIETIQGSPVYRLRGNLLPLVYLDRELELAEVQETDRQITNIVVLQADERPFGLVVDNINDTEEIVVKPLGRQLKGLTAFAGATIMGDGKVALILDVMGLAQKAHVVTEAGREHSMVDKSATEKDKAGDRQAFLIINIGGDTRMAVELSMVARLEEFKYSAVEHSGDQDLVQYREEIMPLVHLSKFFHGNGVPTEQNAIMQVVVYSDNGQSVGLVVDKITDIVDETITVKGSARRKGTLGTVVVQGQVTDLLDVPGIIHASSEGTILAESTEGWSENQKLQAIGAAVQINQNEAIKALGAIGEIIHKVGGE